MVSRLNTIYLTEVKEIGPEVKDFLGEGLMVLFKSGAPPELAEISVLHEPISQREAPPKAGDVVAIGPHEFRITAVGEKAWKNIQELGHAVFKFNGRVEAELPGEICLEDPGTKDLAEEIRTGTRIEIKALRRTDGA